MRGLSTYVVGDNVYFKKSIQKNGDQRFGITLGNIGSTVNFRGKRFGRLVETSEHTTYCVLISEAIVQKEN